jgi:hypothetical protein
VVARRIFHIPKHLPRRTKVKNIVRAIEQETKFMNDSEERGSQYGRGYLEALQVVAEFLSLHAGDGSVSGKATCSGVERLRESIVLQNEAGLFGLQTATTQPNGAARTKRTRTEKTRASSAPSKPACLPAAHEQNLAIDESITRQEQEQLRIALGVLRSGTDYADFLSSWLEDYGRQILSPNPPPPLLPELTIPEELLQVVVDAPAYIN